MELERAGIPTVGIVSVGFENNARQSASAFGIPSMRFAVVPDVLTSIAPDRIRNEAEDVFPIVFGALTSDVQEDGNPRSAAEAAAKPAVLERFGGRDLLDAFDRMNQAFLDHGWGDGFPLIPPTPVKVEKMLRGTSRSSQDVVAIMQPGLGIATVEKIAINAVMAGCSPAHLPILIAAVEAMTTPWFPLRSLTQSTGGHGIVLLVNGPIAKAVGINSGQGALVPGKPSRVNVVIGRASRLIILNIGLAYPGVLDKSTIGSPRKYGMCIAENEEVSPWAPFHVERGYEPATSTVTVFGCRGDMDVGDLQNYAAERLLTTFSGFANATVVKFLGWQAHYDKEQSNHSPNMFLLMAPDHARAIAREGWAKEGVRTYLYEHARVFAKWYKNFYKDYPETVAPEWRWVLDAPDERLIPMVESPSFIHMAVVGGAAGRSLLMYHYGLPVTKEVSE